MEEVAKLSLGKVVEASHMHVLLLVGDFSTLFCAERASQQTYRKYFVVIILIFLVLFLLLLLQVVDLKPSD